VPRSQHDRTIAVHLQPDRAKKEVVVNVDYRLEVDELTVVLEDMTPSPRRGFSSPDSRTSRWSFYAEFTRIYAPILARNLMAKADGKPWFSSAKSAASG